MTRSDLRERIARDIGPVRPLAPPARRALTLVPVAVAILVGVPLLHAFRGDMSAIGFVRAWGFSIGQMVAGLTIIAVALRESVPGRTVSRRRIVLLLAIGVALPAAVLVLTTTRFNIGPLPGRGIEEGVACFRVSSLAALPSLALAAALAAAAFPLRPGVAGALYGLGSGLTADSGLRLYCDYSTPSHVLFAHIGAVAATAVLGAVVAWGVERVRRR